MKFAKYLYGVGMCLLSVFAFGNLAGSASAASLLFKPESGVFPDHYVGSGVAGKFETISKMTITFTELHVLDLFLSDKLHPHDLFLKVKQGTEPCGNLPNAASEKISMDLLGHLGLALPGDVPAVLLLIPSGFEFKCAALGGLVEVPIKIRGGVIARIVSPAVGVTSESVLLSFKQTGGKQEFTTFLNGNEILTNQFEEISINGGAFEQAGQEGQETVKALAGQGAFLLISP